MKILIADKVEAELIEKLEKMGAEVISNPDLKAEDRFEEATRICHLALMTARKLRDTERVKAIVDRRSEIESLAARLPSIKEVIEKLSTDPLDADANLAVGKYTCFAKGQWKDGLKMLALGSDAALKKLAKLDLSGDADKALQIGDRWWSVAKELDGDEESNVKLRAALLLRARAAQGPRLADTLRQLRAVVGRRLERHRNRVAQFLHRSARDADTRTYPVQGCGKRSAPRQHAGI